MNCQGPFRTRRAARPLNRSRFQDLRIREIVRHWHEQGHKGVENPDQNCFEAFIYTWIALNAWGESVTDAEHDKDWVQDLAHDPELNRKFADFLAASADAQESAEEFRRLLPIPSVKAWRRASADHPGTSDIHRRAHFFHDYRISCAPACALWHFEMGEEIPLDWLHFLPSVYQVRCNLFHGEKSPIDFTDGRIVRASLSALSPFMEDLRYFE